jgi:hypothetical protein
MTKLYLGLLFLVFTTSTSFGQIKQLQIYKNLYRSADSLDKLGRLYSPDSGIIGQVRLLDKEHPAKYFETIGNLMKCSKFDDAAFLYYLAILRYSYYNAVNPDYEASGDGALLSSFKYIVGETVNLYLKTNLDNFVSVLKASGDYFAKNDYAFYPKAKSPAKYDTIATRYALLIEDLETNKEKYRKQWDEERSRLMTAIEKQIDAYNKMSPEEKKRLKNSNQ